MIKIVFKDNFQVLFKSWNSSAIIRHWNQIVLESSPAWPGKPFCRVFPPRFTTGNSGMGITKHAVFQNCWKSTHTASGPWYFSIAKKGKSAVYMARSPQLARACGVPVVGVRAVDCWQWRSGHYFHPSFLLFFPFFFSSVATFSHRRSARIKKLI